MALNKRLFDNIVGKGKQPYGMKDNDGDGVSNLMDCQPNNPKEQGFIHRLAAKAAEKVGATGTAEKIRERGEVVDERRGREENIQRDAKKAGDEVYYRRKKEVAIQRAEGDATRRAEGGGGFGSYVKKFIDQPNKTGVVTSTISKPSRKKVVTYKKIKGGKYKKVTSYKTVKGRVQVAAQPKPYVMPNLFGGSSGSSSGGVPNLFGGNKPKKGKGGMPKIF